MSDEPKNSLLLGVVIIILIASAVFGIRFAKESEVASSIDSPAPRGGQVQP